MKKIVFASALAVLGTPALSQLAQPVPPGIVGVGGATVTATVAPTIGGLTIGSAFAGAILFTTVVTIAQDPATSSSN
jgi:hypothetical protein